MSLRALPTTPHFGTSTDNLLRDFYVPALAHSVSYDRGVGYFTSNWLRLAASGLAALAAQGGKARILASPVLDRKDCAAIAQGADARNDPRLKTALAETIRSLEQDLATDTLSALAWMIADGLLDFRVALPTAALDGDFHDKFGIFRDAGGDAIAFHGSPNDSAKAFRNYESVSVYYSWLDPREASRVAHEQARFNLVWDNGDANLRVYPLPDAIRRNLIVFTQTSPRPYPGPSGAPTAGPADQGDRWRHQGEAIGAFLRARHGILEMATGTGKTRTALAILEELRARGLVETAVVAAYGTDLLDQWHKELLAHTTLPVFRAYEDHREAQAFLNHPAQSILLTSRQNLSMVLPRLRPMVFENAMLICDEVHGLGSPALAGALAGRLKPFAYRLGLSATPERLYDPAGEQFIADEIGPVIFRFGLKEAIERGILCEFDYVPLNYSLSDEDRAAVRQAIKRHYAKTGVGEVRPVEALYREIAFIRKVSPGKIPPFEGYLQIHPEILRRSIIFVETAEFGALVQPLLMAHRVDFHTYYQDDDRQNLRLFAQGGLECLLTCHRISEGIDIRSVNNIILFSSSRPRLETVQRLGRCLRVDPDNPEKRACVIDLVQTRPDNAEDPTGELNADEERRDWLMDLAQLRRHDRQPTLSANEGRGL